MAREKGKTVIGVFQWNNGGKPYQIGTYDSWEAVKDVLDFFKALNSEKPDAFAYAVEDSDYSDMLANRAPAS